jgi:hypothetical protein
MHTSTQCSSYLLGKNAMKYGGNQLKFIERSEEAIQWGLKVIHEKNEIDDYSTIFFTLLDGFAKARHDLAVSNNTTDAKSFGRSRMHSADDVAMTTLCGDYSEFNLRLLNLFSSLLKDCIPMEGSPTKNKIKVEEMLLGRKCALEIELLTSSEARKRKWVCTLSEMIKDLQASYEMLPRVPSLHAIDENNYPPTTQEKQIYESLNHHMKIMKQKYPELYLRSKLWYVIDKLSLAFPAPQPIYNEQKICVALEGNINNIRSIYAIGTVRIQIDNKMYALSKYITWASQDTVTPPSDRMLQTTAVILHQDRFLMNDTLKEIAKIFKQSLLWDRSQNIQDLKNNVGLIRYLFAHAMPFNRGSASIAEWLEKLIYRVHQFDCQHVTSTMGDMEAFVAPLWSTFQSNVYDATITLNDLTQPP